MLQSEISDQIVLKGHPLRVLVNKIVALVILANLDLLINLRLGRITNMRPGALIDHCNIEQSVEVVVNDEEVLLVAGGFVGLNQIEAVVVRRVVGAHHVLRGSFALLLATTDVSEQAVRLHYVRGVERTAHGCHFFGFDCEVAQAVGLLGQAPLLGFRLGFFGLE